MLIPIALLLATAFILDRLHVHAPRRPLPAALGFGVVFLVIDQIAQRVVRRIAVVRRHKLDST